MASTLRDIVDQMAAVGIFVPDGYELRVTGASFERFRPLHQKSKKKSAWYRIYENRTLKGNVYYSGSFGIRNETYLIKPSADNWSAEEKREIAERAKSLREQYQKDREELANRAAKKAASLWSAAGEIVQPHAYIDRKHIKPYAARFLNKQLVIPMYKDKQLVGLQLISEQKNEDGVDKRFLTGSDTVGAYCPLGKINGDTKLVYVVEGYATGCSVREATDAPVIVAFNAGNLDPVVQRVRAMLPEAKIVIAGDDDRHIMNRARNFFWNHFDVDPEIGSGTKGNIQFFDSSIVGKVEVEVYTAKRDGATGVFGSIKYERDGRKVNQSINIVNAGRTKATIAARNHKCCVVFPKFKKGSFGTDFNDLVAESGIDAAKQLLNATNLKPLGQKSLGESSGFLDAWSSMIERYTLIYGTTTVWDDQIGELIDIAALRLAWGRKAVDWWLESSGRKMIPKENLVLCPDGNVPEGCVNIFKGWPVEPDPRRSCKLIVEHLFNLCGQDRQVTDWVTKWLAYPLQHKGAKMFTSLVFHGIQEGSGKNIVFDVVARIYGPRSARTITQTQLQSQFNDWLSGKLFCIGDEVIASADRRMLKNQLKTMVTGHTHQIQGKGLPWREEPNLTNFVFLSNELQPLLLDERDRRYMVIYTDFSQLPEYYAKLAEEIENGGVEAFYAYLLDYPLDDFKPWTLPIDTAAHKALKSLGKTADARFIDEWLSGDLGYHVGPVSGVDLFRAFLLWARASGERFIQTQTAFLTRLGRVMPSARKRVIVFSRDADLTSANPGHPGIDGKVRQMTVYFPSNPDDPDPDIVLCSDDEIGESVRRFQLELAKAERDGKPGEVL